jgi:hypothetical protein
VIEESREQARSVIPPIESQQDPVDLDKIDKALESAIEVEKAPSLNLQTEFDDLLIGVRRRIFTILGTSLGIFLAIQFVLIFFVMGDHNVLRMQSFNGALVMAGGLCVVTITSLLLILPTKLIAYESLKLVRKSTADLNAFTERADKVMDKVEALTGKLETKSDQVGLDLKEEGRKIRMELEGIRKAFATPLKSPLDGRRIEKVGAKELASVIESGTQAPGGNGAKAG